MIQVLISCQLNFFERTCSILGIKSERCASIEEIGAKIKSSSFSMFIIATNIVDETYYKKLRSIFGKSKNEHLTITISEDIELSTKDRNSPDFAFYRSPACPKIVRRTILDFFLDHPEIIHHKSFENKSSARQIISLASRSLNILFVEDNNINQAVGKKVLEKMGHRVTIAENGMVALETLGIHDIQNVDHTTQFDLVLLDIEMPILDGYQVSQRVREYEQIEHDPAPSRQLNPSGHITIIAMTAHAVPEYLNEALKSGMDDYITKPIKQSVLQQKLQLFF